MHAELQRAGFASVSHVASLTQTDQHFDQLVEALTPQGRLALIDDPAQPLDVMKLKRKSLSLHWELMFTRSLFETPDMIEQHHLLQRVSQLVDQGVLRTTLGDTSAPSMRPTCAAPMPCWKAARPRARSCWKASDG